jgi:hypothetical protein
VFLDGMILATGRSLMPELVFTLAHGDIMSIAIDVIGAWSIPSSEAVSEWSGRRPAPRHRACGVHRAWEWSGALALNQAEVHR